MSHIVLGKTGGRDLKVDVDILMRTRALIQGGSGSGKSWLLRRMAEQLFGKVPVIMLDPEGEFATLREAFGYVLAGKGGDTPADVRSAALLAHKLLELRASAVCDLYEMKPADRHRWVKLFCEALIDAPKKLWQPVIVIVDEAHMFAPEKGAGESEASDAIISLATRGRKRGFCLIAATQRIGKLRKDVAAELQNVLIGGTFIDIDRDRAAETLGVPKGKPRDAFSDEVKLLEPGNFFALGRAVSLARVLVHVGPVQTSHPKLGSSKHAAEPPPPPSKVKALLPQLADLPAEAETKLRTEADLRKALADKDRTIKELERSARTPGEKPAGSVAPPKVVEKKVIGPKEAARLERAAATLTAAVEKAGPAIDRIDAMRKTLEDQRVFILNQIEPMQKMATDLRLALAPPAAAAVPVARAHSAPVLRAAAPVQRQAAPRPRNEGAASSDLPPAKRRILNALAFLEGIGIQTAERNQLAFLSDTTSTSSAYLNNLYALRTGGYVSYPEQGKVQLTESGRAVADGGAAPSSTEELQQLVRTKLPPAKWRIVQALIDSYPNPISRDELATVAGTTPTSSAYLNNVYALRTLGLLDYPRPGEVVAQPVLFLEA